MRVARTVVRFHGYCILSHLHRLSTTSFRHYHPGAAHHHKHINMDSQSTWNDLIHFWFDRPVMDWYMPPDGLDDEIRAKYSDLITQARSGVLDHWATEPRGVLSLILLLDQFPRNIFRGSGESFSSDLHAQKIVTRAIAQKFDKELGKDSKTQQILMYMPLMHAEDLITQIAGNALYQNVLHSCDQNTEEREFAENALAASEEHLACIAQLGRFPKRNEAIGRPSTEDEIQFLKDHPKGF